VGAENSHFVNLRVVSSPSRLHLILVHVLATCDILAHALIIPYPHRIYCRTRASRLSPWSNSILIKIQAAVLACRTDKSGEGSLAVS
jgi:hypothetical protein